MNQPYSTTASTSTRILQFDTGAVIGEGAPIEGRGALGEAQGIARAVSPVVSLDGGLAGSLDGVASLAVSSEMRRAAMYLVGSERDRRKVLSNMSSLFNQPTLERTTVHMDPEVLTQAREVAEAVGVKVAHVVRLAVEYGMPQVIIECRDAAAELVQEEKTIERGRSLEALAALAAKAKAEPQWRVDPALCRVVVKGMAQAGVISPDRVEDAIQAFLQPDARRRP